MVATGTCHWLPSTVHYLGDGTGGQIDQHLDNLSSYPSFRIDGLGGSHYIKEGISDETLDAHLVKYRMGFWSETHGALSDCSVLLDGQVKFHCPRCCLRWASC